MKEILGAAAVVCEIASAILYYRDIYRGNTKPHLYTMIIWAILAGIVFAGSLVAGAGPGAWGTGATFLFCASLVPIAYYRGTTDITRMDRIFLIAALAAIAPWLISKNPLWSVVLATFIDWLGMLPTMRKTYNAPNSESLPSWILAVARSVMQLAALSTYNVTTLIYLVEVLLSDMALVGIIVSRKMMKSKQI